MSPKGMQSFFDTVTRMVSYFDGGDEQLHRDVVKRMLLAGARVLPKVPPSK